jgi:hypothetical protein
MNRRSAQWKEKQPEGQSETGGLRIVLENKTDDPLFMSNVEINIPGGKKDGDESK